MAINKGKIRTAAQRYAEKGNYDRAIEEYLKIVADDPNDAHVVLKVAELYAKKGDKGKALEHFRRASELFFEQGFDVKAAGVLKQILAIDPTDVKSSVNLARYYKTKGMIVDALAHLEAVYRWLVKHERNEDALELAKEMVSLDPDNVAMRIRLAEAYSRQERRSEAVAEFAVAADLLRGAERIDDFIKVAERLLWHQPDNVAISKELATLYLRKREPRRALQKLQVCFKSNPQDVETLELLAEAFEQLKQTGKAATILKELAKIFLSQGKRDQALDVYARVLDLIPGDREAEEAVADLKPGAPSEAFHQVHTLPVAGGRSRPPEPDYASGEPMDLEMLDDEDVEELSEDAIVEVEEDDSEIARILGETDVFVRYRLFDKALASLNQCLERHPNHVDVLRRLAEVFIESGRSTEAVEVYRRLADVLIEVDKDAAGQALGQALSLAPDDEDLARQYERVTGHAPPEVTEPGENEFDEDLADLSGLQLLEDIEAEADDQDSVYATQELSFQGRKSPFLSQTDNGDSEEVDLAEMAELGLLDEFEESGDVVDLGAMADSVSFGDVEVAPDATIPETSLTGQAVLAAAGIREGIQPGVTLRDGGGSLSADDVAAAVGDQDLVTKTASGSEDAESSFVDDLDRELDELEAEFGSLSASDIDVDSGADIRTEGDDGDTAMVSMDAFEAALEQGGGDEGDEGDEDLDLLPPVGEFDDDEPSDMLDSEDLLGDELEQLEQTGALIARLEKETGPHDAVSEPDEMEHEVSGLTGGAVLAQNGELDFSGLMDDEPDDGLASSNRKDATATPREEDSLSASGGQEADGPVEQEERAKEDAFDILVGAAESALEDVGAFSQESFSAESADRSVDEKAADREPELEIESEGEGDIATSELKIDDLARAWDETSAASATEDLGEAQPTGVSGSKKEDEQESTRAGQVGAALDEETREALEADIEDTEFFIEQGLYHDALEMLEELREQYGDHPLLMDKIEEVRSAAGREIVDEEEEEEDESSAGKLGVPVQAAAKQSVKVVGAAGDATVGEGDAETHFDLGIAYRDMGLLEQAVEEFRKVALSPSRAVQAHLMIAGCFRDMGRIEDAVAECEAALAVDAITKAERIETHYLLGELWETKGDRARAEEAFRSILAEAPSYRDVEDRLERLRS